MQVTLNNYNKNNNRYYNNQYNNRQYKPLYAGNNFNPSYTGNGSKIFDPFKKGFDNLSEWLAKNYYAKFYKSKFTKKFIEKTTNVKNMTTHMAAIGSTLISGMYTIRTLQNDRLDPDRRKTLALNDVLTWALSTLGAYTIDSALHSRWDKVTNRFVANYIKNHMDEIFANEDFNKILDGYCKKHNIPRKDLHKHILTRYNSHLDESLDKYCRENGLDKTKLDAKTLEKFNKVPVEGDFDPKYLNVYLKEYNRIIDEHNASITNPAPKTGSGFAEKLKKLNPFRKAGGSDGKVLDNVSNMRDFNLDLLKSRKLTTMIDGMGILKSLFIFGLVYRYLVPVGVMKPANKLGAYMHKRRAEKKQAEKETSAKS